MAVLSLNEIKSRALAFAREWEGASKESADEQTFWNEFFEIFGVSRKRVARFQHAVHKLDNRLGEIDMLWPGTLLIEHKSLGKDLDAAYTQAMDYFDGLRDEEVPQYVLVSDFARFCLYDLETGERHEFKLADLPKHIRLFGFMAGYQKKAVAAEDPVNRRAAEALAKLHDSLKATNYSGHQLEALLVRLLFCLFADDAGIFEKGIFLEYLSTRTNEDGSDLGQHLNAIFQVLNTPKEQRQTNLDEQLTQFEHIDGGLFAENLPVASFDSAMRRQLLATAGVDWSQISPAIFGSIFQGVMDPEARRSLGAHYTSEANILKLIEPLFLDDLKAEFAAIKARKVERVKHLQAFQDKLAKLTFLDPACGCGNFLVIAYRELRRLELAVLEQLHGQQVMLTDLNEAVKVDVDQFYGIEIEEFPGLIAQTALWLMDHQMNMEASQQFGAYFVRLPLTKSATIWHGPEEGNALTVEWRDLVSPHKLSYILGNPPYIGHHLQTKEQKAQMVAVLKGIPAAGVLDFVSAWHYLAAQYIQGTNAKVAFVSTNSITQGEQVGILWPKLLEFGVTINFAHRTFRWGNDARGRAAVFCVIIGFSLTGDDKKWLFEYETPAAEPHRLAAKRINPYLVDAPNVLITNRTAPLCPAPAMKYGSKPTDGGHFIMTTEEKAELLKSEPAAKPWIKRYLGAKEFLNGEERWCLWLVGISPSQLRELPLVRGRVEAVKSFRQASIAATTRAYPHHKLFRQVTQPGSDYILVPRVSSEQRGVIPMGFAARDEIAADSLQTIPAATLYHLGVLQSAMHMAWVRAVCGRLKGDYRYSKDIVYNNFPWPEDPTAAKQAAVEAAAQAVLDARAQFPDATLADLYDPLATPPVLVKAHQVLDRVVDACYRGTAFKTEVERVEYLFERYQALVT